MSVTFSASSAPARSSSLVALLAIGGATAGVALLGTLGTRSSVGSPWYANLRKPWFQPPNRVFAPVWTALYGLMAASAWRVWRAPDSPQRTRALTLWGTQLALNGAWSWLFFGAKRPAAALAELGALNAMIEAYVRVAREIDPAAGWMMAPYRAWTTFALVLNAEIVRLND